ncbi:hypothetical protein FML44_02675 [Klebsiella michiganensis]|nr:hypothetical protein [Klebsiella michiganensis]MBZ7102089.1 hypothetical protein [Klebsiella michiganensis]MBZ7763626.1 hypothetical protein [Klebsiella michiganensis]QFI08301.1 hypothetical protein FR848_02755 [Klebsiella michiganensis]
MVSDSRYGDGTLFSRSMLFTN